MKKKLVSLKVNLRFETSVNLNKCLEQIKLPITPHTCATIHRLLSSKNTIIPRFCPREHKRTQPISVSWPLILNTYEDVTPNRGKKTHLIIKCVSMIIALRRNNEEKEKCPNQDSKNANHEDTLLCLLHNCDLSALNSIPTIDYTLVLYNRMTRN